MSKVWSWLQVAVLILSAIGMGRLFELVSIPEPMLFGGFVGILLAFKVQKIELVNELLQSHIDSMRTDCLKLEAIRESLNTPNLGDAGVITDIVTILGLEYDQYEGWTTPTINYTEKR